MSSRNGEWREMSWRAYLDDIARKRFVVSTTALSRGKGRGLSMNAYFDNVMRSYSYPHILLSSEHHGKNSKIRVASKRLLTPRSEHGKGRRPSGRAWTDDIVCTDMEIDWDTHILLVSQHHGKNSKTRVSEKKCRRNSVLPLQHRGPRVWREEFRRGSRTDTRQKHVKSNRER